MVKINPGVLLNVQQFTRDKSNGIPIHAENGFMKIYPDGKIEASYSHSFGVNEFEYGNI